MKIEVLIDGKVIFSQNPIPPCQKEEKKEEKRYCVDCVFWQGEDNGGTICYNCFAPALNNFKKKT